MIDRAIDDETLAAFIDGTLPSDERSRVMETLAREPEVYAEFLEAAQVAGAVAVTGVAPKGKAASARSRWRRNLLFVGPFLAAAGLAGVLVLRSGRRDATSLADELIRPTAIGTGAVARELGPGWYQGGWPALRSDQVGAGADLAGRLGALSVQLLFAQRSRDPNAMLLVTSALGRALSQVPGSGPLTFRLKRLRVSEEPEQVTRDLRKLLGEAAAYDAGVWLETTRIALLHADAAHVLGRSDANEALDSLLAALEADTARGWDPVLVQLRALRSGRLAREDVQRAVMTAQALFPQ